MEESKEKQEKQKKEFGFDLYPQRRSGKSESSWQERLFRDYSDTEFCQTVCEENVINAFEKNPLIKLLRGALKQAGCPIDLKRHIVCEDCDSTVQGGYDSEYNQIVVCRNVRKSRNKPQIVLLHELIHMYDYCTNKLDFKNLDHLACTEIRAANIAHCSFLSSWLVGQSSLFDFKKTHQYCVKMRAAYSLVVARNLDFKTALNCVLKVFDKCYNDLEPVGRRVRRNSPEPYMAYEEAKCFNISE